MNKDKMKKLKKKIAEREKKRLEKLEKGRANYPGAINKILLPSNK